MVDMSRSEHDQIVKRIDEHDNRQDKRLQILETDVKNLEKLSASIQDLATNMKYMLEEQINQGKRIEDLEKQDGEMYRKVVGYIITSVVGIVIGAIFNQIGM